jgi:hypothetical protein
MFLQPYRVCKLCEEDDVETPADYELDSRGEGSGGGGFLCDGHYTKLAEDQYESMLERFYGSSSPQTVQEHYDAAAKERRDVRGYGHVV